VAQPGEIAQPVIEQQATREAAKLKALQAAGRDGFAAIDAGRYRDLQEHQLADFIATLGRRAA
jgi:hypothetical protein